MKKYLTPKDLFNACQPEIEQIIRFNRLIGREQGNTEHILLQARMLEEEARNELLTAKTMLEKVDALCDVFVFATGALWMSGQSPYDYIVNDTSIGVKPMIGQIYCNCGEVLGEAFCVTENKNHDSFVPDFSSGVIQSIVAYANAHNIDLPAHLRSVNESNFSKFCLASELPETVDKYASLGVELDIREVENGLFGCYVKTSTNPDKYPIGKLMKCVNFREPVFVLE